MASMTQSASAIDAKVIFEVAELDQRLQVRRHQVGGLGFQTAIPAFVDDLIARALSPSGASFGTISSNVTGTPTFARCAAIAAPIVPEPMTTALWM